MVLGAGRGPLVKASLRASERAKREIKVWAVEKNPNAVVTLLNLKRDEWGSKVTVVSSDMRDWKGEEKADILVSELLGSFGDNELSPECLDGAQHLLKGMNRKKGRKKERRKKKRRRRRDEMKNEMEGDLIFLSFFFFFFSQ